MDLFEMNIVWRCEYFIWSDVNILLEGCEYFIDYLFEIFFNKVFCEVFFDKVLSEQSRYFFLEEI